MLERAKRTRIYIEQWIQNYPSFKDSLLNQDEWLQINYIIIFLHPFYRYTLVLSTTKTSTIHLAWSIYNSLFRHIETIEQQFMGKRLLWKVNIRNALPDAREKLTKYYTKTSGKHGLLYNLGTVLNPGTKLSAYTVSDPSDDWAIETQSSNHTQESYESQFKQQFLSYYNVHYRGTADTQRDRNAFNGPGFLPITRSVEDEMDDIVLQSIPSHRVQQRPGNNRSDFYSEARDYLKMPLQQKVLPLDWWRAHEATFPALSRMAKDVFAVPLAGVGVERVFSIAKGVVTSSQNRLRGETISNIMLCKLHWKGLSDIVDTMDGTQQLSASQIWEEECVDRSVAEGDISISDDENEASATLYSIRPVPMVENNFEIPEDDLVDEDELPFTTSLSSSCLAQLRAPIPPARLGASSIRMSRKRARQESVKDSETSHRTSSRFSQRIV